MQRLPRSIKVLLVLVALAAAGVTAVAVIFVLPRARVEMMRLEDRTGRPLVLAPETQIVADLEYPPGNIAVAPSGRVFITFHPTGNPPYQLVELRGVTPFPYPDEEFQSRFGSLLSLRVDRQDRLWALDYANYGVGKPRLFAFDLESGGLLHEYAFPSESAGFLSMLNDFQVDPEGKRIYIADTSPILERPALVVYDVVEGTSRRLLEGHPSVMAKNYIIQAPDRDMKLFFDLVPLRIAVDSIVLDTRGEWLYYGPMNGDRLYRIATEHLNDESLSAEELAEKVEDYGPKTISDGLSVDVDDNIYITDPEHSAVVRLTTERKLETVVKDSPMRWPDGLSFGPGGWMYVTCSALHQVMFRPASALEAYRPYHVIRFKPGPIGIPGH